MLQPTKVQLLQRIIYNELASKIKNKNLPLILVGKISISFSFEFECILPIIFFLINLVICDQVLFFFSQKKNAWSQLVTFSLSQKNALGQCGIPHSLSHLLHPSASPKQIASKLCESQQWLLIFKLWCMPVTAWSLLNTVSPLVTL